ncbi:glutamic acid-rich protein-like [Trematomus bernacchii]|uniref:glutamic acid-rich protein-like n=1 Tax=Trematomus bernacchii TaxID=40690 RepID=UPI00146BD8AC|nr:glutamic acid-rich protein-like [Trematomus bernacchii]
MEELQRPGKNKNIADIRKAASKQRLRPTPGENTLMEVAREIKAVQRKPIAVQSVSSPHTQVFHLNEQESLSEVRSKSKEGKDLSKKSKNEKNQKEAKAEVGEGTPKKASKLGLVAGAASIAAGALIMHQVASRGLNSPWPSLSESVSGVLTEQRTRSESHDEDYRNKSAVSINIIPQSPEGGKETSQEEREEEGEEEGEEVSHSVEKVTEDDEEDSNTLQPEEETDEGEEVSKDEEEEVSHSVDQEEEEDGNTLQTEDDEDEDKSSAEEEEGSSNETESAGRESESEEEEEGDLGE